VITGPAIAELQKAGGVIQSVAAFDIDPLTLPAGVNTDAIRITGMQSSPNLFDLLGVRPAVGRGFLPHETGPDSPNVVVLTDRLWKRLGGDPVLVGSPIKIGATPFTVIGIMPPGFGFSGTWTGQVDAYIPLYIDLAAQRPYLHDYMAVVRAASGALPEAVHQAVHRTGQLFSDLDNHQGRGSTLYARGLKAAIVADERPALRALSFAVIFLLLVLTVNLASLLLARAAARERELALSRALGANSAAIVRATLIEGALLGLASGIAGTLVGWWATRLLVTLGPSDLPRRDTITMDVGIGVIVVGVGVILGVIAASAPGTWASRMSLGSLVASSAIRSGTRASTRMRRALIVVQVALCLALLSAGGLVARSFERLLTADPGFESDGALTFSLGLGTWLFPDDIESQRFQERVDATLRALPGVTAVGATSILPLAGGANVRVISFPGAPGNTGDPNHDDAVIDRLVVRSGYVEATGIRIVDGRGFEPAHRPEVREALIDSQLADEFYPNQSPIGETLRSEGDSLTIVGVVQQARLYNLHRRGRAQLFVRAEDYPGWRPSNYVVRTNGDPQALTTVVQSAIHRIDRRVPISSIRTMSDIVAERRSRERLSAVLISGLGIGALLLVVMGLFGVVSGSVTRRQRELAVRLALGATHRCTLRLVIGEGALLVGLGLLFGVPGVYAAGNLVRALLIDVSPWDPPTLIAVALGLALVTMAACYVPARRVLRIDPAPLLRQE
jgi:putative ABC transport system permease protein